MAAGAAAADDEAGTFCSRSESSLCSDHRLALVPDRNGKIGGNGGSGPSSLLTANLVLAACTCIWRTLKLRLGRVLPEVAAAALDDATSMFTGPPGAVLAAARRWPAMRQAGST